MKRNLILSGLLILMVSLVAFAGCGEKDAEKVEAAAEVAVTHDCAGGCGMTKMPADKTTEVDGKFYCAGCAKKAEAGDSHEGHSH